MTNALTPGPFNLLVVSLAGWFFVVNALTFLAFYLDQLRAVADRDPVPGGTIVLLSTVGGWLGAQIGRLAFPEAEREGAFGTVLNLSILPVLFLAGGIAAMDVDWPGLVAKVMPATPSPAVEAVKVAEGAMVPLKPALPVVLNLKKPPDKPAPVTSNADLPQRIGPKPSKAGAWHAR